jgi:phosphohistidine phosphatase
MKANPAAMQIYLLRHGAAEEAKAGKSDADRALLQEGEKKLRRMLEMASQAGVQPTLMLSSPLKRAVQTAEIAQKALGYKGEILRTRALVPDATVKHVWDEIRVHRNESSVMLVGHNPLFSNLAGYLLGCAELQIDFKKGAMLRVDVESFPAQPKGILRGYLTSKVAGCDG